MTTTNMSDKKFIALTRENVAAGLPADADENMTREFNGRVAWLAKVDANGGRVPRDIESLFAK